nr:hypothetical protein [Tanacetum cinerariifolium]
MTSFGYRFNPRYAIKECSSCGTLYTRDCVCSIGTDEDKILVPKPSKNCARCTRCGYLVDGPNCQGCALLHQELEENLVTYSPDFQNCFEPSNASTNIVNSPREPYVVKQDNGRFVDKIIFRAPDSPDQFYCFHCKDVLRAGEACKRCPDNSLNDSPSISETSSQSPPDINHCCYECGDPLDGIFCKRCTCKSCGKNAHIGYNCPSKVLVISNPESCNNQTIDELPQTLPIFHPTFHSEAESLFTLDSTLTYVDESPNAFNPPPQSLVYPCEFCRNDAYYGHYCTPQATFIYPEPFSRHSSTSSRIEYPRDGGSEAAAYLSTHPSKRLTSLCFDDDDDDDDDEDYTSAITPDEHVLSTEEPDDSLSMGDEHLDTIPATKSDEFIKSGVETLIPILTVEDEFTSSQSPKSYLDPEGDMLLFKTFLNDDHSSDFKTKSSSTSLNYLLEETNNFNNSLPEFTTFLNVLCDAECESDSSDDQSCSNEDVLEKIVSKPLCEEEIVPMKSLLYQDDMKERQTLSCVDNSSKSNDDMERKYTQSNTVQHAECFKQKMLLVQLQEAGIQLSKPTCNFG